MCDVMAYSLKKTLETEVSFNSFLRQIQRDIKSKPYSIAL